ncbi:MAG: sigma-54 dependent transcriptional regulator [Desulfobacca sp.]|nr:sigma-54 dependent transcriptional regulator [Desulfobacca sp.]
MGSKAILVVDNEPHWGVAHDRCLAFRELELIQTSKLQEARQLLKKQLFALVAIADHLPGIDGLQLLQELKQHAPTTPVLILTDRPTVARAVAVMKQGAWDYLAKPLTSERLQETLALALKNGNHNQGARVDSAPRGSQRKNRQIITRDPTMQRLLKIAETIAPSRATVLIQGESGTGKELFARYIHAHSDRAAGPFVAVNCASLPEGLLESELFGHEKGAFTGAIMKKLGKFEIAQNGTLLLDEISEMHPQLQAKLLRVLQENEIDRVGGTCPIPINVRVIGTTNRDLAGAVDQGEFREDLYYRLNVINLTLPPLRQRRGDVSLLADYFLNHYAQLHGKEAIPLTPAARATLEKATWKGNVRELENAIARGVLLSQGNGICPEELFPANPEYHCLPEEAEPMSPLCLRDMERQMIFQALDETEGNRTHAAKLLGISVRTLRNKLHEYKNAYV